MRQYRGIPIDKPIDSGEFVYGGRYEHNKRLFIVQEYDVTTPSLIYGVNLPQENFSACFIEVHPATVGQSTGLPDKNGKKEAYVGDDVYFSTSQTQHYKGYVKWSEKGLCYVVECYWEKQDKIPHLCDGYEMNFQYSNTCVRRLSSDCFDIEIIGNVHKESKQ